MALVYGIIAIFIGALLLAAMFITFFKYSFTFGPKLLIFVFWTLLALTLIIYGIKIIKQDIKSKSPDIIIKNTIQETKENVL